MAISVDFKITAWERVIIPADKEKQVIAALKSGEINTANKLIEFLEEANYCGVIAETETQLTVKENGGKSTIEVIDEEGETIFKNV